MKKLMAFLLAISLIAVSLPVMVFAGNDGLDKPQQKGKFSDTAGHWAENVIEKMADSGIIRGVGNGKFLPDVQMKRSEFVVALHKAAEIQIYYIKAPNINEFFDDANNEDWFASSLYDLASLKIVDDEDREFRPNDFITREEMVHYLMNAYRYKLNIENFDEDDDAFEDFSDWKNVKQRYKKSVKRAYKLGFIKGRGNRMFVPEGFTTRAEALIVLDKLMEAFKDALKDVVEQPVEAVKVEPSFVKVEDGYEMRLTISNNSKKDIVINHNSGQKYDFMLLDDKKEELYRWSQDMAFILPLIDTTIEAGKTVEFTQKIDFKTYESIEDKVYYFKALIVGDSKDFKINKDGYYLSLKEKKENSLLVEPEYEKSKNTFTMKLKLQNTSDKDITINHTSSQKFDFKLLDKNKEILYTWSADKLFMAMLTETVIGAGKTVEFEEELDMENYKDVIGKAKYLKAYVVGTSEDCDIEKDGYEIEITESKENSLLVEPEYEKSKNTFTMKLKLQNTSDKDITINHTSSQKFDFKLLDKNKEILYTWSADKLFMAMLTETVIGAGKTVEFEEELDMESYKDIIGKAKYLKAYIVGTSEDCELEKDGYEVEIK